MIRAWIFYLLKVGLMVTLLIQSTCLVSEQQISADTQPVLIKDQSMLMSPQDLSLYSAWQEIKTLIDSQQYGSALKKLETWRKLLAKNDNKEKKVQSLDAYLLLQEVQLKIALSQYEEAIAYLKSQTWPKDPSLNTLLGLFYAYSLQQYVQTYAHEINARPIMQNEAGQLLDKDWLKRFSKKRLVDEIKIAYQHAFENRAQLYSLPLDKFLLYIQPNNYPAGIRDTLRDAVSYAFVDFLMTRSFWSVQQIREQSLLNVAQLTHMDGSSLIKKEKSNQNGLHPLAQAAFILKDLAQWHDLNKQQNAALHAQLSLFQMLYQSIQKQNTRRLLIDSLSQSIKSYKSTSWAAFAESYLAEWINETLENPLLAYQTAKQGDSNLAHPFALKRLLRVIAELESPQYNLQAMRTDGLLKPSVSVRAKNINTLYFRVYRLDLVPYLASHGGFQLLPEREEILNFVRQRQADYQFSVALDKTQDYQYHTSFVQMPIERYGTYIVVTSLRSDFSEQDNLIQSFPFFAAELVLRAQVEPNSIVATLVEGSSGKPRGHVTVSMYEHSYGKKHNPIKTQMTNKEGQAVFKLKEISGAHNYFLVAGESGQEIMSDLLSWSAPNAHEQPLPAAVVYTDKSIYRPLQKIYYKVFVYQKMPNKSVQERIRPLQHQSVRVSLVDPNGEKVTTHQLITNDYGTVSSEFLIPQGRLAGAWRVDTEPGGQASVQVESYVRPSFEAHFLKTQSAFYLNQKVTLNAEALYYSGAPVSLAKVSYYVERVSFDVEQDLYGPGFFGFRRPMQRQEEIVAQANTQTDALGHFSVHFIPQEDASLSQAHSIFRYRITASVTHESGETQTFNQTLMLGFESIQARIEAPSLFLLANQTVQLSAYRLSLDEIPQPGSAKYQLFSLQTPKIIDFDSDSVDATKLTSHRMRFKKSYDWRYYLSLLHTEQLLKSGVLEHNAQGLALIDVPALNAGAYRIVYETKDSLGKTVQKQYDFVVYQSQKKLPLPAFFSVNKTTVNVGENLEILAYSDSSLRHIFFTLYRNGQKIKQAWLESSLLNIPIKAEDQGELEVVVFLVQDYQLIEYQQKIQVPFVTQQLDLQFKQIRQKLSPKEQVIFQVQVKDMQYHKSISSVEILGFMYDASLDAIKPHVLTNLQSLYQQYTYIPFSWSGISFSNVQDLTNSLKSIEWETSLSADRLKLIEGIVMNFDAFPRHSGVLRMARPMMTTAMPMGGDKKHIPQENENVATLLDTKNAIQSEDLLVRKDFADTVFFMPHLISQKQGEVSFDCVLPDNLTSYQLVAHGIDKQGRSGVVKTTIQVQKELMVRPQMPRFLRESDEMVLKTTLFNQSGQWQKPQVSLVIRDVSSKQDVTALFKVDKTLQQIDLPAGQQAVVSFMLHVPKQVGQYEFLLNAQSGTLQDAESHIVPVLPSRMHVSESHAIMLNDEKSHAIEIKTLQDKTDTTLLPESLVVQVDAQLFESMLHALPYLYEYPYESVDQILNRLVPSMMLSSVYQQYPQLSLLAQKMSARPTFYEPFSQLAAHQRMLNEETPFLRVAQGKQGQNQDARLNVINLLSQDQVLAEQQKLFEQLKKYQNQDGGFAWWPGGDSSTHMTLYVLESLSYAQTFHMQVPPSLIAKAWGFVVKDLKAHAWPSQPNVCCLDTLVYANYVASLDDSAQALAQGLSIEDRVFIFKATQAHLKSYSLYLKTLMAMTAYKMNERTWAESVMLAIMDIAKTDTINGTYWAPEDKAWLWYQDRIQSHAFLLRALNMILPKHPKKEGLVQWLFLNKKMNHWSSPRATAETIYALVEELSHTQRLLVKERVQVQAAHQTKIFEFDPAQYQGPAQWVLSLDELKHDFAGLVQVQKQTSPTVFVSATLQFSTDKIPNTEQGDVFSLKRQYYVVSHQLQGVHLKPIDALTHLKMGDEVEVHLSVRALHAADYVHLRDPRASGMEPTWTISQMQFQNGLSFYQTATDNGAHFFFESLPAGEYTLSYRLRVSAQGTFAVAPAQLQSLYAPEFSAYSKGQQLLVKN